MDKDKQLSTKENTTSFPVLLNDRIKEIEAIPEKEYTDIVKSGETPEPVAKLILSMASDTYKGCVARCYDGTSSIKQMSTDNPIAYNRIVKMLLVQMSFTLNVKEGLKPEQRNVIPSLLLTEFGHLRINDIGLICRLISTGRYKLYERLDVETFFSCVREYESSDERITARENHHKQNHTNKQQAVESFKHLPQETQDLFCKRKEAKIMLTPNDIPPMAFKATQKDSMKKLKGERHD